MLIQNNFEFNSIFIRGSKSYFLTLLLGNIYLRILPYTIISSIILINILYLFILKNVALLPTFLIIVIISIVFKINALSYARKLNMLENNLI